MDEKALAVFGDKLLDRKWRLSNLYYITDKTGKRVLFKPNWAQAELFENLGYRNLDLKVRQIGATTGYCILWLDACLFNKDLRVGIVAHTKDDAKVIFRDKIKYAYNALPDEIRSAIPAEKLDAHELLLNNGSGIRVGVTFRSGTVQILHVTEYGYICARQPQRAEEIRTGAFQAVPKDGIIVVESTAKGRAGHFYELTQEAQKRVGEGHDWHFTFLPWWKDPEYSMDGDEPFAESQDEKNYLDDVEKKTFITLTRGQRQWYCRKRRDLGDDIFAEYPSIPEEAFRQSAEGAYYGRLMLDAWRQGRVTTVPIDPSLPVETWWDIGYGDSTAIWFVQRSGYENRAIDYYENSGEGVSHYAEYIRSWRESNNIRSVRCIGPHDLKNGTWANGESQLATAASHGLQFEIAPEKSIADGIEAARRAIPLFVFDEERCGQGIKCLESYRKKWNEALGTWHNYPLHDWASHGADAFRYGVLSMGEAPIVQAKARSAARPLVNVRWK